jgi:hypothetical protein
VLRGAGALPTRASYRVAPGVWRREGTLGPVSEQEVRGALHVAPLAILHGDTSIFGSPRSATTGSLALVAPPADTGGEWYPVGAPASPIAGALAGIRWDSLPPLDVSSRIARGTWEGLSTARARQFDRRAALVGSDSPRRVVIVGAAGFWRWRFRGGTGADAYAAVWGSIFDWLSAERSDARRAIPAEGAFREGERIRWRRGSGNDSVVTALIGRHGVSPPRDTLELHFGVGSSQTESDALRAGAYDVRVPGGQAMLVVNASRELLPRVPSVRNGSVGGAPAPGERPRLRDQGWAYLLALALLCAEWVLRRRVGMR